MFVGNRLAVRNARRGKHPNGRVCSHWRQRNPHICTVLLKGTHLGSAAVRHRLVVTAAPNVQDVVDLPAVIQVLHDKHLAFDVGCHVLCENALPIFTSRLLVLNTGLVCATC